MRAVTWHRSVLLVLAGALGACSTGDNVTNNPDAGPEQPAPVLVSLVLSPAAITLDPGASQALTATGTFDDGSTAAVTTGLTWSSSATAVATISSSGVAIGVGAGTATITATRGSASATATVTVTEVATGLAIFTDDFAADLAFAPFDPGTVVEVDPGQAHAGSRSLKLVVPTTGFAGGAVRSLNPTDVSAYNAVTFWAKASKAATLNVVGFGNDLAGSSRQIEWTGVALTTDWVQFVIPLPSPSLLTAETGVFHFAEGSEEGAYSIWFDDIRYQTVDAATLGAPSPAIATSSVAKQIGETVAVAGTSVTYTIDGAARPLSAGRGYFTYASSDPTIASVDAVGMVTAVGVGTATITAKLGTVDAVGAITVAVSAVVAPTEPATAPTAAAADVIALFSDAYTPVAVSTWRTPWSDAVLTETTIGTDNVKKYSNLNFVGIELPAAALVDATTMTHVHLDVWLPAATTFRIKLVDFGANGVFNGTGQEDDVEFELPLDATTTPAITGGVWIPLDLPLTSFTTLVTRAHIAQLILSTNSLSTVYVDNVYFHRITPPM